MEMVLFPLFSSTTSVSMIVEYPVSGWETRLFFPKACGIHGVRYAGFPVLDDIAV